MCFIFIPKFSRYAEMPKTLKITFLIVEFEILDQAVVAVFWSGPLLYCPNLLTQRLWTTPGVCLIPSEIIMLGAIVLGAIAAYVYLGKQNTHHTVYIELLVVSNTEINTKFQIIL